MHHPYGSILQNVKLSIEIYFDKILQLLIAIYNFFEAVIILQKLIMYKFIHVSERAHDFHVVKNSKLETRIRVFGWSNLVIMHYICAWDCTLLHERVHIIYSYLSIILHT